MRRRGNIITQVPGIKAKKQPSFISAGNITTWAIEYVEDIIIWAIEYVEEVDVTFEQLLSERKV